MHILFVLKVSITFSLIFLLLTTSIISQVDAKGGGGGFRGGFVGGGGSGKSFSSNSVPLGTGPGKTFTGAPSGKINPQETMQQGSKQSGPSSSSGASGSSSNNNNNPQNNFQSQSSQSQFQPRSNFFGGFGGGLGGFGNMIMASIMGNFIGQALFGWMMPHQTPVAAPAISSHAPEVNSSNNNNSTHK